VLSQESAPQLELRDYLRVIRRRKGIIALTVLLCVGAALAASLSQTKIYQASADVLLQPRRSETLFDPETGARSDPARAIQTEIRILSSKPVRDEVQRQLGTAPAVAATPVGQTDVIQVRAQSADPASAAQTANAYANAYIATRRKQSVDDLFAAAEQIQAKVDDLQVQIDEIPEAPAVARGQAVPVDPNLTRRSNLVQQQALFKQKLDQLQVDAALKTGGAQLVTPASAPGVPIKPTPRRNTVLGLLAGLMLGVGFAFLREYLDDSIKSKEDVDRVSGGAPVLGLIPVISGWKDRKTPMLISVVDPKAPAAEGYRSLRTSIQFIGLGRAMGVIQVTSPTASEGKSTTLANLGVALALAGNRVVVIDCDLRRPRIHDFFEASNDVGFTSVLLGEVPLSAALQPVAGVDRLQLLASGPPPPNPSELLSGKRTVEILEALRATADVVLIDCPPALPVTDAAVLSSRVDATLLVATAGSTHKRQLSRAIEVLSQVKAPIVGIVLNGVSGEGGYGYAYSYSYRYTTDDKKGKRRSRKEKDAAA
jgi:non-specific protein-tyrosine kinase